MNGLKKRILETTVKIAYASVRDKDKSMSICPAFFHQPRRPEVCKKNK